MRLHSVHRGSGEPMLLIHGLGASHRVWDHVIDLLAQHHEVNALDLPGFGKSAPLQQHPTPVNLADAVASHMAALGWETAHVVGNSLGGLVSMQLGRLGHARSITALSPGGMAQGLDHAWAMGLLRAQVTVGKPLRDRLPALARTRVGREALLRGVVERPGNIDPELAVHIATNFVDSPSTRDAIEHFDPAPIVDHLDEIHCPVTIAWGTKDRLLVKAQGERYKRAMPQARLIALRGLGHMPMSDDPHLVTEVILRTTGALASGG